MTEAQKIEAAHPLRTGRHDLYDDAMRLVGERHAKADLVELVNWLLYEAAQAKAELAASQVEAKRLDDFIWEVTGPGYRRGQRKP